MPRLTLIAQAAVKKLAAQKAALHSMHRTLVAHEQSTPCMDEVWAYSAAAVGRL